MSAPAGGHPESAWVRVHGERGFLGIGSVESGSGSAMRLRPRRVLFPDGEESA
jgi:hypothetical protein